MMDKSYRKTYEVAFKEALNNSANSYYDEAALPSYTHKNRLMAWLFWKRIDTALSLAGDLQDRSVFDFGCGGGVTFKYLSQKQCQLTVCDDSYYDLAAAMCKKLDVNAMVCRDLFTITDMTFDVIFALDVLEHVDDIDAILDKLVALSHHGTIFILSGPTENLFYKAGRLLAGFSGHYHVRNIYDIEKQFRSKGLREIRVKSLYLPIPLFRVSSWQT